MASSGNVPPGVGVGDSVWARGFARWRSTTQAAKTFRVSGEGESSKSRRSASKKVKAAAAEGLKETSLTVLPAADSKGGTRAAKNSSKLDVDIWSQLHEDQQAAIIAKLPLRELFQAMSLSKTWRLRFHSDPVFRCNVRSSSTSSIPYVPLYMNQKKGLLGGYERNSKSWRELPPHWSLLRESLFQWHLMAVDGPLFCWLGEKRIREDPNPFRRHPRVVVTNPLTDSWRELPPFPEAMRIGNYKFAEIIREGDHAYKVLLYSTYMMSDDNQFLRRTKIRIEIRIFDSTDGSWNMESYSTEEEGTVHFLQGREGGRAFIQGVLQILFYNSQLAHKYFMLISLDLRKKVFKQSIRLKREFPVRYPDGAVFPAALLQLVVCESTLMLVIKEEDIMIDQHLHTKWRNTLSIFRFDLERSMIIKVSRAPENMLHKHCRAKTYRREGFIGYGQFDEVLTRAACDGHSIYIGNCKLLLTLLCYDLGTQKWHSFDSAPDKLLQAGDGENPTRDWEWISGLYQPGLDPLLSVG